METTGMPLWLRATAILGALGVLVWLEQQRPLRRTVEPRLVQIGRNLAISAGSALAVRLAELPLILPLQAERWLVRVVVTPRMHGIHHSTVLEETNSNWSSGLSFWDRLHGTLRLNVPQDQITIGVPAYRTGEEVSLGRALELPFIRQKPNWPDSGGTGTGPRTLPSPDRDELLG